MGCSMQALAEVQQRGGGFLNQLDLVVCLQTIVGGPGGDGECGAETERGLVHRHDPVSGMRCVRCSCHPDSCEDAVVLPCPAPAHLLRRARTRERWAGFSRAARQACSERS
eukprot:762723-Hanusia_phi.AAC.10